MATLDELPDELILAIVERLDFPTLRTLNHVNWHFYNLTIDSIYTTTPGRTAARCLRTVALSPSRHLARLVKNIEWRTYLLPVYETSQTHHFMSGKQAIVHAYQQLGLIGDLDVDVASWVRGTPTKEHWFLELFLSFLPNVGNLKVYDAWHWDDHTCWFRNVAANPSRLKVVEIDGPMRIQNIHPLLTIPSLRDLTLHQVVVPRREEGKQVPWEQDDQRIDIKDASVDVEKLELYVSCLSTELLVELIGKFRNLKDFAYEHSPNEGLQPEYEDFEVDEGELAKALERHDAGMENVDILY